VSLNGIGEILRPRPGESHDEHMARILADIHRTQAKTSLIWAVGIFAGVAIAVATCGR
jgi:hypothetical protein